MRFGDDAAPYFEVRSVKYGKAADKEAEKMPTPTDAECGAVKLLSDGENGRRLMSTTCASGRCSNVRGSGYDAIHLWDATQAAYMTPGEDANTGFGRVQNW